MASHAFSLIPDTFFTALIDFASSIDSPLIQSILDGLLYNVIPLVVFAVFLYVVCYVCLRDIVDDLGPEFDDLDAGTLPLLGRRHGGPVQHRRDPQSKREALMRIEVYKSDEGKDKHTDCVVCLEDFMDGEACLRLTCCEQPYHRTCVNRWLLDHRRCPICHAVVRVTRRSNPICKLR